uniref:Transposable element P transposase-like RNase H domain-containing protein n=1 Tax=Glossina austeni TaxID=7395 RepID=A0A1A9UST4_GLOAU
MESITQIARTLRLQAEQLERDNFELFTKIEQLKKFPVCVNGSEEAFAFANMICKGDKTFNDIETRISQQIYLVSSKLYEFMRNELKFNLPIISLESPSRLPVQKCNTKASTNQMAEEICSALFAETSVDQCFINNKEEESKKNICYLPVQKFNAGIKSNDNTFKPIKEALKRMREAEKICSLHFDEVGVEKCLTYNEEDDVVERFVDFGSSKESVVASGIMCFMIRSLFGNYKLLLSYYCVNNLNSDKLSAMISDNIDYAQRELGLNIKVLVCDECRLNTSAVRKMRKKKPEYESIVSVIDYSHLLKDIYINLQKGKFQNPYVMYEILHRVYRNEKSNEKFKLCPQLTKKQFTKSWYAGRYREHLYAAEVFSKSMIGAIQLALDSNWFGDQRPEIVTTTRVFMETIDFLSNEFNIFGYHNKFTDRKTLKPPHSKMDSLDNLIATIDAVINLKNNLFNKDEHESMQLNLGKLDQDCLERLFYEQLKIVRNKFKSSKSIYETKKFFSKLMSWKIVRGKFDEDDEFLVDNSMDEIGFENYFANCAEASFPITSENNEKEQAEQAARHFFTERVVDRYFKLTNACLKCSNLMMKEDKPTLECLNICAKIYAIYFPILNAEKLISGLRKEIFDEIVSNNRGFYFIPEKEDFMNNSCSPLPFSSKNTTLEE